MRCYVYYGFVVLNFGVQIRAYKGRPYLVVAAHKGFFFKGEATERLVGQGTAHKFRHTLQGVQCGVQTAWLESRAEIRRWTCGMK